MPRRRTGARAAGRSKTAQKVQTRRSSRSRRLPRRKTGGRTAPPPMAAPLLMASNQMGWGSAYHGNMISHFGANQALSSGVPGDMPADQLMRTYSAQMMSVRGVRDLLRKTADKTAAVGKGAVADVVAVGKSGLAALRNA